MNAIIVTNTAPSEIAELAQKLKKQDSAYCTVAGSPWHREGDTMHTTGTGERPKQFFGIATSDGEVILL